MISDKSTLFVVLYRIQHTVCDVCRFLEEPCIPIIPVRIPYPSQCQSIPIQRNDTSTTTSYCWHSGIDRETLETVIFFCSFQIVGML